MEPITDDAKLLERMRTLFASVGLPGLAIEICELSYEAGTVTLEFEAATALSNQLGFVQGGVIATMLDACIGMAGAIKSGGRLAMPLAEMKTTFLRPVKAGRIVGKGETLRLGKNLAFIEASLHSETGALLARASGTASPVPFPDAVERMSRIGSDA